MTTLRSILIIAVSVLSACSAQAPAGKPTNPPTVVATATAAPTPTAPPTATAPAPTSATATATAAAAGCSIVLTAADIDRGFPLTVTRDYVPTTAEPGFVEGTQLEFESGLPSGDEVASTLACFDTAGGARSQFDKWGVIEGGCINANFAPVDAQEVDFGPLLGADDSKGTFCPADGSGQTKIAGSASVYVLRGPVVFSVSFNRNGLESVAPDVIVTIAQAAAALLLRLGGV